MLGAIFTGLSGLNAYSKGLQTISNNLANLNTSGFKSTKVSFSDLSRRGGIGGSSSGSNRVGGVELNVARTNFTQGELRATGNGLDLAVDGQGFLIVRNEGKSYLARTAQFLVDEDGYISQIGTKYRLAGRDDAGALIDFNINAMKSKSPVATTKITFAENLSSTAQAATVSDVSVYDANGGKHVWTIKFAAVPGSPGEWNVGVADETGADVGTGKLKFIGSSVDPSSAHITIGTTPAGAPPLSVDLDFSVGVSSFSSGTTSTLHLDKADGSALGTLAAIGVDDDGKVKLTYSNGDTDLVGSVALMDVRDANELDQIGNGLFEYDAGVQVQIRSSGDSSVGKVLSGRLEASNVDLSGEFGELILVQRGFQACSQVISVSNDMIQQLFGIRGQG